MTTTVEVRERPILFSGPMVRAILDGRKTQTRRVLIPQPVGGDRVEWFSNGWFVGQLRDSENSFRPLRCPFGQPGDRLWVRETTFGASSGEPQDLCYRVACPCGRSDEEHAEAHGWRPSIHMPRWASRLTLEVTDVRVERLQDCSAEDAIAEGLMQATKDGLLYKWGTPDMDWADWRISPIDAFEWRWNQINAARGYGWDVNPWVWVVTFQPAARAAVGA